MSYAQECSGVQLPHLINLRWIDPVTTKIFNITYIYMHMSTKYETAVKIVYSSAHAVVLVMLRHMNTDVMEGI